MKLIRNQCIEILQQGKRAFDKEKIVEQLKYLTNYALSNPLLLFLFIVISTTLLVPLALFTVFIVVNVAIAFTTFMVVEVTIITIGASVLGCVMFFILSGLVAGGIFFILFLYISHFTISLVKKKINPKE